MRGQSPFRSSWKIHPFWEEGTFPERMRSMCVTWELTQPRWWARSWRETHNWRGLWASPGSQSTGSLISRLQSCGTGNKRIGQSYQFAAGSKNRRLIRLLFSISSLFHNPRFSGYIRSCSHVSREEGRKRKSWDDTYAIPGWKYEEGRGGGEPLDERLLEPNRHSAERLKKKTICSNNRETIG